jgi:hypothetical protein
MRILIVDDSDHELSAGFSQGSDITLVSDSGDEDILTFCVPEIDNIPIAVSKLNPLRTIAMGVEKGTTVWNKDGTVISVSDSTVTQSRAAMVGIFAAANDYITDDGFGITAACKEYLYPLIKGEAYPPYDDNGMPRYVTLKLQSAAKKLPGFDV